MHQILTMVAPIFPILKHIINVAIIPSSSASSIICLQPKTLTNPPPLSHLSKYRNRHLAAASPDAIPATEGERQVAGESLPVGLRPELMPRHVAVIMDGNARWARQRGLPPASGHLAGARSLRKLVEMCCNWGIRVLTVFAFSYDNWIRPQVEVDFLMSLFEVEIKSQLENFLRDGIQVSVIGDSSKLPKSLQKLIENTEEITKGNSRLQLIVAMSYSGRHDIVQACRSIALKVRDGVLQPEDISSKLVEQELQTSCTEFPCPDLLIRASGELRVSDFLLWQLAYSELFFITTLWPDFGETEFVEALNSFQERRRRYGGR